MLDSLRSFVRLYAEENPASSRFCWLFDGISPAGGACQAPAAACLRSIGSSDRASTQSNVAGKATQLSADQPKALYTAPDISDASATVPNSTKSWNPCTLLFSAGR